MLTFPKLTRKPALKTRGSMVDPTIRDSMENGMEATRARFTRSRRQWSVSIDMITPADAELLDEFVSRKVIYGAKQFVFKDERDPRHPKQLVVRFSVIPSYSDAGNVEGEFRQNCTFEIREV